MKPASLLSLVAAAAVHASVIPTTALEPRQQQALCELYAYWSGNGYELLNNLWGKDTATSGSQCTYLDGTANGGIQWSSTWTWQGAPNNVKSYPYVGRQVAKGRTIASVSRMPTTVRWDYDTENVRANVAYDVFTAADPNHPNYGGDYELMIWLARYGNVYPIGQVVASVNLAGYRWDLWTGYNGAMRVYSFVPPSGTIKSFSADVKDFYNYLVSNYQFPAAQQNIIVFQVGTEAFTGGPAKFTCQHFTADVI
jgi:xyloglucan-specific endo-beta-1,4-glucanase